MPATITHSPAIHPELFAILDGGCIDFTKTGEYYLVAADWCEERGLDAIAAGLRALARRGRRPLYGGAGGWRWHREYRVLYYERDYPHYAPGAAFDAMVAARRPYWAASHKSNGQQAIRDLIKAGFLANEPHRDIFKARVEQASATALCCDEE